MLLKKDPNGIFFLLAKILEVLQYHYALFILEKFEIHTKILYAISHIFSLGICILNNSISVLGQFLYSIFQFTHFLLQCIMESIENFEF